MRSTKRCNVCRAEYDEQGSGFFRGACGFPYENDTIIKKMLKSVPAGKL